MALGHRWPWDQVGGARVDRGTVALRCLGCLPTITSNISGVKDAQRSRRQSIWAVYTSLRHTAKYTGFGCISYVYSLLASSRLACQDIQRIQHIQPIQPYSHTRHRSYSAIQPPSDQCFADLGQVQVLEAWPVPLERRVWIDAQDGAHGERMREMKARGRAERSVGFAPGDGRL